MNLQPIDGINAQQRSDALQEYNLYVGVVSTPGECPNGWKEVGHIHNYPNLSTPSNGDMTFYRRQRARYGQYSGFIYSNGRVYIESGQSGRLYALPGGKTTSSAPPLE